MGVPVTVNVPHKLGTDIARKRIGDGIGKLGDVVPGAVLSDHHWDGDTLHFTIDAMGQRIIAEMQVRETEVYGIFDLPPLLGMFANRIKDKLMREAPKMLE